MICEVCGYPIMKDWSIKGGWKHTNGFVTCLTHDLKVYRYPDGTFAKATPGKDAA